MQAKALLGLGRPAEAIPALTRAFEHFNDQHDDAGIARVTLALAFSQFWRARIDQGVDVLTNGLLALSAGARRERCQLQAELATALVLLEHFDQSRMLYAEAMTAAEQMNDPHTLGLVLTARTNGLRSMHRLNEVIQTGQRAQVVLDRTQSWQRAETARNLALSFAYTGRFADLDSVLNEIERTANRVGHFGAQWVANRARAAADLASSGNIEAFRRQIEADLQGPAQWRFVTQLPLGVATFYLGDVEAARTVLNAAAAEQPARSSWEGVAEANLLATWAFTGDAETAHRALPPRVADAGARGQPQPGGALARPDGGGAGAQADRRSGCRRGAVSGDTQTHRDRPGPRHGDHRPEHAAIERGPCGGSGRADWRGDGPLRGSLAGGRSACRIACCCPR